MKEFAHIRTQRLLDESLEALTVIESNSEEMWAMWDMAVEWLDRVLGLNRE